MICGVVGGLTINSISASQMLSYCTFMAHPVILIDLHDIDFKDNLDGARIYLLFAIVVHFGELKQSHSLIR